MYENNRLAWFHAREWPLTCGKLHFRAGRPTKVKSARAWFSAEYRARAATLYEAFSFSAAAAGARLGTDIDGRAPGRAGQFCQRMYLKSQQHGSLANRPIPGRRCKVPKRLVQQLVSTLVQPTDSEGEPVYIESIDHALQQHSSLRRKFQQLKAHPRTISRSSKQSEHL